MIKNCVPDAVTGTIESGGESASFPATGVSAVTPVAASVGGGSRSYLFLPEVHHVAHRSGGFCKIRHFLFACEIILAV